MPQRVLFALLALTMIAAPAVQAMACRCTERVCTSAAEKSCCCCGDADVCTCCCGRTDGESSRMDSRCPCDDQNPWSERIEADDIPAPGPAIAPIPSRTVGSPAAANLDAVIRIDPHPEVVLPLLI